MTRLLISAGEASSDLYGAQLMEALRRRIPELEFMGVGGEHMRAAGCEIVVDARHLAVVGITEIVGHLPNIYGQFRKLLGAVDRAVPRPAAAIVIDSPAFNFRVAREMHARGIPVIYFVAPQLWAWRQYRVRRVQRWIKKVLCIFPFEVEFYRGHGVDVEYVGYPLADMLPLQQPRAEYAQEHGLDPSVSWIALLPGSRRKEVRMHLSRILAGAERFAAKHSAAFLLPRASTLEAGWMQEQIASCCAKPKVTVVSDARAALSHARAAVVASGTATVEAALEGCPFVTVYRLSPLTYRAARRLVKVRYAAMPNLIAGEAVVPELLQNDFTAEKVAHHLAEIVEDGPVREKMLAGLARVRTALTARKDGRTAMERAAEAVLATLPASVAS